MNSNNRGINRRIPYRLWLLVIFMTTVIAVVGINGLLPKLQMLGSSFSGYSTFGNQVFQDQLTNFEFELSDESDMQEMIGRFHWGEADLMAMTLDQFLRQKPKGKIVGLIDRSVGADGAVLNTKRYPSLTSLEKLRSLAEEEKGTGQPLKIVYAADSTSEFFLEVLINNGYDAFNTSFKKIKTSNDRDAWKRLESGQDVALAILRDPYLTIAQQKGYKKVEFFTKDEPTIIIDVIVASNRLIQNQPQKLSQFLAAYYHSIIRLVLDEKRMQKQILSHNNFAFDRELLSNEEAERVAERVEKGIHWFTALEANDWLTNGELDRQVKAITNLLNQADLLDLRPQNPQKLFTAEYMADAVGKTNAWCGTLPNTPEVQKLKKRVCALTPPLPSSDEEENN